MVFYVAIHVKFTYQYSMEFGMTKKMPNFVLLVLSNLL